MPTAEDFFQDWEYANAVTREFFGRLLQMSLKEKTATPPDFEIWLQLVARAYTNLVEYGLKPTQSVESFLQETPKQQFYLDLMLRVRAKASNVPRLSLFEQNIEPRYRYLIAEVCLPFEYPKPGSRLDRKRYEHVSQERFERLSDEIDSLIRDGGKSNQIVLGLDRVYGNIELPKVYDIVFDTKNPDRFWECKAIVKYAFNYRTFFHTDLWLGHPSEAIVEFPGAIPEIFNSLPVWETNANINYGIGVGLCTKFDWQYVKPFLESRDTV